MPVNQKYLLYSLAKTFNSTLNVDICEDTKVYVKKVSKLFAKLDTDEKMYYTKYSLQLAQNFINYLGTITMFELNTDPDAEVDHEFRLVWKKKNIAHISMLHTSINTKDIIPEKLMRICKYKRNTNVCKEYTHQYKKINDKGYKKIQTKSKYSELSIKTKNKAILEPICDLTMATLSKKRKCANNLFNHLFNENDRIVLKLYKNRFTMYDFSTELPTVESFRMKHNPNNNEILITFNNGAKFNLVLHTNASEIKEHLSIKFHTSFKNMDELFAVPNSV